MVSCRFHLFHGGVFQVDSQHLKIFYYNGKMIYCQFYSEQFANNYHIFILFLI